MESAAAAAVLCGVSGWAPGGFCAHPPAVVGYLLAYLAGELVHGAGGLETFPAASI